VFVVDNSDSLVLRISMNGAINVVAGNGIPGFSGDGGPATSASLYDPVGVAVDSYFVSNAASNANTPPP
jgi:hypothetical protein